MSYYDSHHNIFQLFGGYLNQSWKEMYLWDDQKPTYQPIVRKYKLEFPKEDVEKTITELKEIMAIGKDSDEEGWDDILVWGGLGLGLRPQGFGLTDEEWLKDVLRILEEPIEETRKHWIPKGI